MMNEIGETVKAVNDNGAEYARGVLVETYSSPSGAQLARIDTGCYQISTRLLIMKIVPVSHVRSVQR